MRKIKSLLPIFILFCLCFNSQKNFAQPSDFYKIDTTNFHQLTDWERTLIDTFLVKINSSKSDTHQISLLYKMYSQMNDNDVWAMYLELINTKLESNQLKEKYPSFYYKCKGKYYNDMGYYLKFKGLTKEALEHYHKGLQIREKYGNNSDVAILFNNIGALYLTQNDYINSLDFFERSYNLMKETKDSSGLATALSNIGTINNKLGNLDKAIEKLKEAEKIHRDLKLYGSLSNVLNNLGSAYLNNNQRTMAFQYLFESLAIRREYNNALMMANSMTTIGNSYFKIGDYKNAQIYADSALELANQLKYPEYQSQTSKLQYEINKHYGNWKKALEMHEMYFIMSDSINNNETQKATIQQQARYEYEKQKAIDDATHEKQIAIEQEAREKQRIISFATTGGLTLVVIFLFFIFNRLQITKKQKMIIEKQKTIVETAHFNLEEKNQEILDSINYAKRIQSAILPPKKLVKEYLPNSFVIYKPKDIVAGDFYWMEHKNNQILFAAADCTGHGVPGALVSVICNNGLNRSVREYGLTDPGKILDKTREIVIQEFEKSDEDVKDGMDIALCSLSISNKSIQLEYAGAHNPLWIIRSNSNEIEEIKADKQPIGKFDNTKPYTTHSIKLQKGDSFYIFSDGFADQFGGVNAKKFKTVNFKRLLLSIQDKSVDEQSFIINKSFEDWKGNLEQLDDVCIIGVRI